MKVKTVRVAVAAVVFIALAVGLALNFGTGTLSAFGWRDLSLLCPLGALTSMIAGKTLIPRALIALVMVIVIVLLVGRAFCSWICPVPLVQKLRHAFTPKNQRPGQDSAASKAAGKDTVAAEGVLASTDASDAAPGKRRTACGTAKGCEACHKRLGRVDSRHVVLGGAVLSAAVFGFPVFCLVCPIGLAFGTVLLLIGLFGHGDVTWSVVLVPALLLIEVVFFRHWCGKICPMGAFLSLVSKGNRTLRPVIDKDKCLETTTGAHCGRCTLACEEGINLRNGSLGASVSECTRCLGCVEACPAKAIKVAPLAPRVRQGATGVFSRSRKSEPTGAADAVDEVAVETEV